MDNKKDFLIQFCNSSGASLIKILCSDLLLTSECLLLDSDYKALKAPKKSDHIFGGSIKKSKLISSKKPIIFKCRCNKDCLSIPIIQGNTLYGYVLFFHLKDETNQKTIKVLQLFIDIVLKGFQKEQELNKLYDTIRPRAIALSTIHTIHRLLTSTLDMNELIERIARLTLQVMRCKYCSMMLLDSSKKFLIPKAVINLKTNVVKRTQKRYRRIKVSAGIEGKVVKTGKAVLLPDSIYVPLVEEDVIGVISAKEKTNNTNFDKFELEILLTLAEQAVIAITNAQLYEEQEKMAYASIKTLSALLDTKSPNAYTHSDQFVKIVLSIAEEMRLPREEILNLHYAALLPDTGRFSIPEEILKKPGMLSRGEYNIIKKQHLEGLKVLEHLEFLKPAFPIIRYHHERYNGTGYPEGLKGGKIPIGARIMAVADAFEAMVSSRPYKGKKITISQAIKEIEHNKGTQFDPEVVDAFLTVGKRHGFKNILIPRHINL